MENRQLVRLVSTAALLAALAPGVLSAQVTKTCDASHLNGGYGFRFDGTIVGEPGGLFSAVGLQRFDGNGRISGTETISFLGLVMQMAFTGTYSVNSDCTGTMTATFSNGFVGRQNFVIVDGGKEIIGITVDPGAVLTGVFKKL